MGFRLSMIFLFRVIGIRILCEWSGFLVGNELVLMGSVSGFDKIIFCSSIIPTRVKFYSILMLFIIPTRVVFKYHAIRVEKCIIQ